MADHCEEEARNALDLATLSRGVGVNLLALFSKLGRPAFYLLAARPLFHCLLWTLLSRLDLGESVLQIRILRSRQGNAAAGGPS